MPPCPHGQPRGTALNGNDVALSMATAMDNRMVGGVSARWQSQVTLTCDAELGDKLFGALCLASHGLYRERKEVGLLCQQVACTCGFRALLLLVGSGEGLVLEAGK